MKRLVYMVLLLCGFLLEGTSQQTTSYSQYMLNGFLVNPAVAGSEGYSAINLTVREQWVGFQDGPATYALSFQTRLMRESHISRNKSVKRRKKSPFRGGNVGLGGHVFNHRNGAVDRTGVRVTYAYHLELDESQLSFGLSMLGYQYRVDKDRVELEFPDDDYLWLGLQQSVFIPDADAGVYYMAKDYWAGFSVDQLFESALKFGDTGYDQLVMERNYYLMGGYDFLINKEMILSPSAHLKFAENGKVQADINGKFYYKQSYWGGITYRTGHSLIVMAGVSVDRLVFGYAFDIGLNSIMKNSFGTHEFTFIAKLGDMSRRHRWLNRY
ncbi:MAG: type IX secretion system membrane protein PorP/SprF [Bacteroidales bacterium]|nr:type IX secretion system membrane protein PorP/SprF [Bacteroidales bacterium]